MFGSRSFGFARVSDSVLTSLLLSLLLFTFATIDPFGTRDKQYQLPCARFRHRENVTSSAVHGSVTSVYLNLEWCTASVGCCIINGSRKTNHYLAQEKVNRILSFFHHQSRVLLPFVGLGNIFLVDNDQ